MSKKRVHEIAKEHGLSSKELLEKLKAAGIEAKAAASSVEETAVLSVLGGSAPQAEASPNGAPASPPAAPADAAPAAAEPAGGAPPAQAQDAGTSPAAPAATAASQPPRSAAPAPAPKAAAAPPAPTAAAPPAAAPGPAATAVAPAPGPAVSAAAAERVRPTRDSRTGERTPGDVGPGGRRRVVIDSQASRRQQSGPSNQPQRRPRRGRRRRGTYDETIAPIDTAAMETTDLIRVNSGSTVKDIAEYLGVAVPEVIKKLMSLGEMATLTQTLSDDAIQVLAAEFGKDVEVVHTEDETISEPVFNDTEEELVERPPVVTIMGHVDHGKTSLLDAIRQTQVAAGEAGGITQHIGAYQVQQDGREITFLDTPGHEAFTAMRARGAKVTDIAVIVVAADDGVKPQTQEAVDHAKEAGVPMLVAVNKIDKPDAKPERVKQELMEFGLVASEWGGDATMVEVSAKKRLNLEELLEMVLLQADVMELKANPNKLAKGTIVEAKLDKGRGPVATVLVQEGTLKAGDYCVVGIHSGRVRAMQNERGEKVLEAGPSKPVELVGLSGVPDAGDVFVAMKDEKQAKEIATLRQIKLREVEMAKHTKLSLEDLYRKIQSGEVKDLNVIVKGDVQGSVEAVGESLRKLSTDAVRLNVIHSAVGAVTETDVNLAAASNAIIIGFNVRPEVKAQGLAEKEGVDIRLYNIIYDAVEDVKKAMEGLLSPTFKEKYLGRSEVRELFSVPKIGTVAGCHVQDGKMLRNAQVRLLRDNVVVYEGKMSSLRRFKDDVKEVASGYECGIGLENYNDLKIGDIIEAFEMEKIAAKL